MCGDCFVCIYLVCQCDGLELGRRNRRITVRGVAVRMNTSYISNQAFLTHTGNITYDDHVLDSLNEIPPTARVV